MNFSNLSNNKKLIYLPFETRRLIMYDFNDNLAVIRHAQTVENEKGYICTRRSVPSVEKIEKLASSVIHSLLQMNIQQIITSNVERAIVTGEYIKKMLKIDTIRKCPYFDDLDFGIYEGKDPHEIKKIQPNMYNEYGFFKYYNRLKGGESLDGLEKRVHIGLKKLEKLTKDKSTLLVTHGSVIVMLHKLYHDSDYYEFYPSIDKISHNRVFIF